MLSRVSMRGAAWACAVALVSVSAAPVWAQVKGPEWKHGLEFRVRKASEQDFGPQTKKYSCEVYHDTVTNQTIYICETSALSSVTSGTFNTAETKKPTWLHGLKLSARKPSQADFDKDTPKYGIEVFKDENTGLLVYISDTGSIAVVKPTGTVSTPTEVKAPKWSHALVLKCRKGGQENFDENTPKYGIEAYIDENNGNLIYITDKGDISVTPPPASAPAKDKAPKWLYGVEFRVRTANESEFTKSTFLCGAEIFKDESTGNLVYISEKGSIGVLTQGNSEGGKSKEPTWVKGFALKVRKAGEVDFTKDTTRYGGEYFEENNSGNRLYIVQTGMIAVTTGK